MRASGRGEAVWACDRGVFVTAGAQNGEKSFGVGCFGFCFFVVICMRFLFLSLKSLLFHGFFESYCVRNAVCMVF